MLQNCTLSIFQSVFSNGLVPLYDLFNIPAETGYPPSGRGSVGIHSPGHTTAAVHGLRKDLFPETSFRQPRSVNFRHEHAK